MYFLIQLKRANVARHELILFYTSCIRSVMTYASPAFFYALPLYLKKDLENVEKRALSIICPGLAYRKALELSNIMSINDYIASLCKKTFLSIANNPAHRLAEAQEYLQKALTIDTEIGCQTRRSEIVRKPRKGVSVCRRTCHHHDRNWRQTRRSVMLHKPRKRVSVCRRICQGRKIAS